jgi:hypothetical protein
VPAVGRVLSSADRRYPISNRADDAPTAAGGIGHVTDRVQGPARPGGLFVPLSSPHPERVLRVDQSQVNGDYLIGPGGRCPVHGRQGVHVPTSGHTCRKDPLHAEQSR